MMPLSLIDCAAQVRTLFDDASLAELATDVAARGVLQPILLRPTTDGRYLVIAGERRLRACVLAQLPTIPAIVGKVDDAAAAAMQLAENIQREDLHPVDEAAAVRNLYERAGNSVTIVAERLHKSKSMISKRLAASCPDLHCMARKILEGGFTEYLEIILTLNKLQPLDWHECQQLCEKIKKGEAGRQTVRETYDAAKAAAEQRKAEDEERNTPDLVEKRKAEQKQREAEWKLQRTQREADEKAAIHADPHRLLIEIEEKLEAIDTGTYSDIADALGEEVREILRHHLECLYLAGTGAPASVLLQMYVQGKHSVCEMAAFMGVARQQGIEKFSLEEIFKAAREALQGKEA